MAKYILKRVLMAVITLFIVICLTFFLMNAVPGNPWLSEKTPTQATIDALNAKYGLDQPVIVQLGKYLENLIHLDFGTSIKMQKDRPVLDIILTMFPISAGIGAIAIIWAILVGVPLGCLAAYKRGTWVDSLLRVICTLGISMPGFVVATMLLHLLTGGIEGLKLFPTMFDGTAKSYVLPCLALGFYPMCYLSRQTRTAMLDAINQEYIKTARAKGLKTRRSSSSTPCATPSSRSSPIWAPRSPSPSAAASWWRRSSPSPVWAVISSCPSRTVTIPSSWAPPSSWLPLSSS